MSGPKQIIRQRDFTGGQVDSNAKRRDDEPIIRASARQVKNCQILPSGGVKQRPGRRALFSHSGRVDQVRMSPSAEYSLCFGNGTLEIRDSTDAVVATQAGYAWTTSTVDQIVWDVMGNDVIICFPNQIQKVANWDGSTTWTFLDYAADSDLSQQKKVPFYRFAERGITMDISGLGPSVTVTFSDDVLVAAHVGCRFRYYDRQILITAYTSPTQGTATIVGPLRPNRTIQFTTNITSIFFPGDVIEDADGTDKIYVGAISGTDTVLGIRLEGESPAAGHVYVGPSGQAAVAAESGNADPPAIVVWDEEVFSSYRGYPQSISVDQNRAIFTDFPSVPGGVAWSALGDSHDFAVGADAVDGFFEVVPGKSRCYHIKPGADEFVFTDLGIYYIPISESNPLRPGSVTFRSIPGPPSSKVEPVSTSQGLVYVGTGLDRVIAIVGTGQTAQPYITRPASDLQSDLFTEVIGVEVEDSGGSPPEDRVYAWNADGTVAVGRYQPGKEWVGWSPWDGSGEVTWVSCLGTSLLFTTEYSFASLCEAVDPTIYLDACIPVNDIPDELALSDFNGATLSLMDGRRYYGDRSIASGAIDVEPGDDFSAMTVVAGVGWDVVVEPFLPHVQPGQSAGQAIEERSLGRVAVTVSNSTGFRAEKYNPNTEEWVQLNDQATPTRQTDNPDAEPPAREETKRFSANGTAFDPRWRVVKDFPGPVTFEELTTEIGT